MKKLSLIECELYFGFVFVSFFSSSLFFSPFLFFFAFFFFPFFKPSSLFASWLGGFCVDADGRMAYLPVNAFTLAYIRNHRAWCNRYHFVGVARIVLNRWSMDYNERSHFCAQIYLFRYGSRNKFKRYLLIIIIVTLIYRQVLCIVTSLRELY